MKYIKYVAQLKYHKTKHNFHFVQNMLKMNLII